MTDWHGYPQHPDAHPERPWWRWCHDDACYERADGATYEPDEASLARALGTYDVRAQLAAYDASHPLPAPPPLCGQVWVRGGYQGQIADVMRMDDGHLTISWGFEVTCRTGGRRDHGEEPWPPPRAILVAGPGAPWAPMGGEHG